MGWMTGSRRRAWLQLHRWLGLVLGPVIVLLALTGSLLVFYVEIDRRIEPAFGDAADAPIVAAWQPVLDALQRAHPQRESGWRIELPPDGRGIVTARYLKPAETDGAFFAPLLVSVDPQTGKVLANRLWGRFAATWIFDLHYTLLGGAAGRMLVGAIGALFALSLAAGLVLWWPHTGQWRAALRLKRHASAARRHYDLHKAFGLGGAVVLLLLALTGAALAWPEIVEPAAHGIGTALPMPSVQRVRDAARPLITLDDALARVRQRLPEGVPRWVDTPGAGSAVLRVRLWLPGDPSRRFPRSYVWVDAHTGEVLAVRDARGQSAGDTLLAWLHPLHNGEAFGLPGRVIACIAGLLPLGLALTGWQRWRDRRRAAARRSFFHNPALHNDPTGGDTCTPRMPSRTPPSPR